MVRVPTDGKRTVRGWVRLSNCVLSQTDQIVNLGIQSCLWFAVRIGVSPVRSFDVPNVRFRCVPPSEFRCPQCKFSVCPPFRVSMSPV